VVGATVVVRRLNGWAYKAGWLKGAPIPGAVACQSIRLAHWKDSPGAVWNPMHNARCIGRADGVYAMVRAGGRECMNRCLGRAWTCVQ
jgi:hypothetical protein